MIYLSSKIVLNVVFAGNFSDDVKKASLCGPIPPHRTYPTKNAAFATFCFCYYRVVPRLYELNDDFPWAF